MAGWSGIVAPFRRKPCVRYTFARMVTLAGEGAQFQFASDQSLLVCFGQEITLQAHQQVMKLLRSLQLEPVAGVRNLHPGYCSLLVKFDGVRFRHDELET